MTGPSIAEQMRTARRLYADAPAIMRALQILRPAISPFEELISMVPTGARVLDVGCGGGLFLGLLAESKELAAGTGFDSSKPAIDAAQVMAKNSRRASSLEFEYLSVDSAWPSGSFDVVSMVDVMHHISPESQQGAFIEATRHVRPGGLLLYKDMARSPWWGASMNRLHDLIVARQWIHYVPIERVTAWADDLGLRVERASSCRMYWYFHEALLLRKPSPSEQP